MKLPLPHASFCQPSCRRTPACSEEGMDTGLRRYDKPFSPFIAWIVPEQVFRREHGLPRVIVGKIPVCPALLNRILQSAVERVEQMELLDVAFVFEMNRIVAGETSVAEATLVAFEVSVHALIGKIGEGIGFDKAADLFD